MNKDAKVIVQIIGMIGIFIGAGMQSLPIVIAGIAFWVVPALDTER